MYTFLPRQCFQRAQLPISLCQTLSVGLYKVTAVIPRSDVQMYVSRYFDPKPARGERLTTQHDMTFDSFIVN